MLHVHRSKNTSSRNQTLQTLSGQPVKANAQKSRNLYSNSSSSNSSSHTLASTTSAASKKASSPAAPAHTSMDDDENMSFNEATMLAHHEEEEEFMSASQSSNPFAVSGREALMSPTRLNNKRPRSMFESLTTISQSPSPKKPGLKRETSVAKEGECFILFQVFFYQSF